jgi:endonuclease-3
MKWSVPCWHDCPAWAWVVEPRGEIMLQECNDLLDDLEKLQNKARAIFRILMETYGEPDWRPHRGPVDELILTILSANTNDRNSGQAFDSLVERFDHDWEAVRTAPLDAIKDAIRVAGMYNQKAPRIVQALEKLKAEQGEYSLEHVNEMTVEEAQDYLSEFAGVGHKTASIVLLFCFNKAAFPVDTHVQRVSQRLGMSGHKASARRIKDIWECLMPGETYFALHLDLIRHGREICVARDPRCAQCALQDACDYFNQEGDWKRADGKFS